MKLILALLLYSSTSFADILAEPYLSYHTGELSAGSPSVSAKQSGVMLGARTGYQWAVGAMAGLDYGAGSWVVGSSSLGNGGSAIPSNLGVFGGFNFAFPLRVYLGYDLSAHLRVNRAGSASNFYGQGWKIGVGWKPLEWLSMNAEFLSHTYGKDDVGKVDPAVKSQMFGLSVSFPLTWACTRE